MTTQAIQLNLEPRIVLGKKVKTLRKAGIIPVHFYGPGVDDKALQCDQSTLIRALSQAGGTTPIIINVPGEITDQLVFAREIQWEPVRGNILHVDLLAVRTDQRVSAQVPISLFGDSPGAREAGGTVILQLREVSVEAMPLEIPNEIVVDLAQLTDPNGSIRAGDLELGGNVTLTTDIEEVIARIEVARAVEETMGAPDGGVAAEPEEEQDNNSA